MLEFVFLRDYVFPIAVLLMIVGLLIDQIRLMAKVRNLEMWVYNRNLEEQMEKDKNF